MAGETSPLDSSGVESTSELMGRNLRGRAKTRVAIAGGFPVNRPYAPVGGQDPGSKQIKEIAKWFKKRARDFMPPPYPIEQLAQLMEDNCTHYACVMAKAAAISSVGWKVSPNVNEMAVNAEITRLSQIPTRTDLDDGRLKDLLAQVARLQEEKVILEKFFRYPNPSDTFQEINLRTDIDNQSLGNAYWEVVRDFGGPPVEIFHIPSVTVRLLVNRTGVAQVRAPGIQFQPAVLPNSGVDGPWIVYFRFFNEPWIMDWRNGRIHGVFIADAEVENFLATNLTVSGSPLFEVRAFPDVLAQVNRDPSPPGYQCCWYRNEESLDAAYFANEVIWWKRYSVRMGDSYGIPDIVAAMDACAGDRGAHQFQLDYFENHAVPRAIVNLQGFPPGDPEEDDNPVEAVRSYFEHHLRGQAHKTLVIGSPGETRGPDNSIIPGGNIIVEKLSEPVAEAGFLNYLKSNREEIMRAERVPVEMLGSFDQAGRPTSTGESVGLEVFKSFVIRPEQSSREHRINRLIQEGFGFDWTFNFLEIDTLDELRAMEVAQGYYNIHALTINEIRLKMGLDSLPGGDRPFIVTPMGLVFMDEMEGLSTKELAQTPNAPLDPNAQGSPNGRGNKVIPEDGSPEKEKISKNSVNCNSYGIPPELQHYLLNELWFGTKRSKLNSFAPSSLTLEKKNGK